jgi:NAD(P)H dehydrogenase (quinone)
MKIPVILGHPNKASFNHAIATTAVETLRRNGHDVVFHDLYAENFDPMLPAEEIPEDTDIPSDIEQYCVEISEAEGIVIVHPDWWGQPPAILKGWIDRTMRPGTAYRFDEGDSGEGVPKGLLRAKAALVFTTSNTLAEREQTVFGDPLETIWKNCVFDFCGIKTCYRRNFSVIVTSTEQQRKAWLKEVKEVTTRYFPR